MTPPILFYESLLGILEIFVPTCPHLAGTLAKVFQECFLFYKGSTPCPKEEVRQLPDDYWRAVFPADARLFMTRTFRDLVHKTFRDPDLSGPGSFVTCITTVKQNARHNIFTCSAPRILEEVMSKSADVNAPPASRPKTTNLTRMANRVGLTMRPKDPKDLDFELDQQFLEDQIPNFKTLDIYASGQRHLLVYSETSSNSCPRQKHGIWIRPSIANLSAEFCGRLRSSNVREPSRIVSLDSSFKRAYNERGDIFSFLGQVMALPFLPPEHIAQVFQHLEQRARSNLLITFMDYIWRQWITNPVFLLKNWSVFMAFCED
uniref:Uncharacterized protein n=1 Tax=Magallana gigas TaxID=29159 RepID=K1RB44_MAGGI